MMKYKLIGTYSAKAKKPKQTKNINEIYIPLINASGDIFYGVSNVLRELASVSLIPNETSLDLLMLALMVFIADTKISREISSDDSWTREIILELPVKDVNLWNGAKHIIERMLNFLSGDIWALDFVNRNIDLIETNTETKKDKVIEFNYVSLFSGGMDSLISTIDLLENGKSVILCGHANDPQVKKSQTSIVEKLQKSYSQDSFKYFNLWTDFRALQFVGSEDTTRSRSFLFIAFATFVASSCRTVQKILVPENGLIALNVPLDPLRVGSHSTHTTHPFYLSCWNELLELLQIDIPICNPYWNKTKGEMAKECKNSKVLIDLMKVSFSCSSPSKARWQGKPSTHCGYCYPCLIRRAAMHFAFNKDPTVYVEKNIKTIDKDRKTSKGIQIRSVRYAASHLQNTPDIEKSLVHKSGPLPRDENYHVELANVYRRGLLEIENFINANL